MDQTNLILLILLALGVLGNNTSVSIAAAILLLIRLVHLEKLVPLVETHGLQVGIIVLTLGVLAPIANGKIGFVDILNVLKNPIALFGLATGIFVSYLGVRGVSALSAQPLTVTGILIGTIVGVAFFKGIPVGPLIAAGAMALVLQLFHIK